MLNYALVATAIVLGLAGGQATAGGPKLAAWGHDPASGLLVNLTPGAAPFAPLDPSRPTIVVVHGINPFSNLVHFTIAERYAETIERLYGPRVNVAGWDWNGDTLRGLGPRANDAHALAQGEALGRALLASGIDPVRLHLIGHSSGGLVAARAARSLTNAHGRPVGRLTLLDPAVFHHRLIFESLGATSAAMIVENHWAPGPSGYGRAAPYAGVQNQVVRGPNRFLGLLRPMHSDHMHVVRRHLGSLEAGRVVADW